MYVCINPTLDAVSSRGHMLAYLKQVVYATKWIERATRAYKIREKHSLKPSAPFYKLCEVQIKTKSANITTGRYTPP